jgi:hypothetical protein
MKALYFILLASAVFVVGSFAYAQTDAAIAGALADVSKLVGKPVATSAEAKGWCNMEKYLNACAEIGKKHKLYKPEELKKVDALLDEIKGNVAKTLAECTTDECLLKAAKELAARVAKKNPQLAAQLDLTEKKVAEQEQIVKAAKEVGIDVRSCREMDPDIASTEMLRACAKLAKHPAVQVSISPEAKKAAEEIDKTAALKEAFAKGTVQCGDNTIEGCGNFCLKPAAEARARGIAGIPAVCRKIAEQYFGEEGVRSLEEAYKGVGEAVDRCRANPEECGKRYELPVSGEPPVACPAVMPRTVACLPGQHLENDRSPSGCAVVGNCVGTIQFPVKIAGKVFTAMAEAVEGCKALGSSLGDTDRYWCADIWNTAAREPVPPKPPTVCPALPTVQSCPAGMKKAISYSSPECGEYYTCVEGPKATSSPQKPPVCPALPTVESCPAGMKRIVSFSSPECGSYYTCKGEKEPDVKPPVSQKEQVWNSRGLRSLIRADADPKRIEETRQACANVAPNSNVWFPKAGEYESADFGMPDVLQCKQASACKASEYWSGTSCIASGWDSESARKGCVQAGGIWEGGSSYCRVPGQSTTSTSTAPVPVGGMRNCFYSNASKNGASVGYTVWCERDYYNCHKGSQSGESISLDGLALGAPSSCESGWSSGSGGGTTSSECRSKTTQSSCSAIAGCYWYTGYSGSNYCDTSGSAAGGSSCSSNQYWNGTSCVNMDTSSMQSGCASAGGTWNSASNYCQMPNSGGSTSGGTCSSMPSMCYQQSTCTGAGHYWCASTNLCYSSQASSPCASSSAAPKSTFLGAINANFLEFLKNLIGQ